MKKNLLFIFADQWKREAVGHRNNELSTPNIDKFYEDSLSVNNAVSTCPLCSPNRAAILTGRYPMSTGVWTNCKTGLEVQLAESEKSIANLLKESNYNTGYIGKWHLDTPDANKETTPISGAKNWDAYTPPGPKRKGFDFWYSYGADDNHLNPHYWMNSHDKISVNKWSVEHETDVALKFLEDNKEENFALFLSWNPPHTPLDLVPKKYVDIYSGKKLSVNPNVKMSNITDHTGSLPRLDFTPEEYQEVMAKYYGAISGVDEHFGRIIEYLKTNGLYDNTIIVLTADHGELLCAHSLWSKHVWYEESIGVPFYIRGGDQIPQGETDLVLNGVDIMPTLLSMLDVSIPLNIEGKDLSSFIKDGKNERGETYICAYPGQVHAVEKFKREGLNNLSYGWRALREKNHLYVINNGYSSEHEVERFLYNLKEDPYQMNPIVIDRKKDDPLIEAYEEKLKEWTRQQGDPFNF